MNVQLSVAGASMGIIYGLVAIGMMLILRSVDVVSLAQGEFLMFGGYFYYTLNKILSPPVIPSLVLASLNMEVVGILFMRAPYQPLHNAQTEAIIVNAMGVFTVFKEGARLMWGSIPMTMNRVIQGIARLDQATVQWQDVAIITISAIIVALVYTLLEKIFVGNITQVTVQDQYMASPTGVPMIVSVGLTSALSAMVAGVGGRLLAPIFFPNNAMGTAAGAKTFATITIGDFGSVSGAVSGGLIVGLVEAFGGAYISSTYQPVPIYVVLIAVLMLRSRGVFGEKVREKA